MLRVSKRIFLIAGILLLFLILSSHTASYADETDPVIRFYLDNVDYVFDKNYIFNADNGFSCNVESILETTDYRGRTDKIDTTVYQLFYSKRVLDSSSVFDSAKSEENILLTDFHPPRPWKDDLMFDFYPNDTGAGELAISFESYLMDSSDAAIGFLNLDRNSFFIEELFVHNPNPEYFERISEIYVFERSGDFIFLRQYERQAVKLHFFGRQFTKQTFNFSDYQIK